MDENQNVQPQPVVEPQPVATPAPVAEPVVAQVAPQPVAQPQALPTETKDRTRQEFEKLLDNNRRLFENNQLLQQQLQESRQPKPAPTPAPQPRGQVNLDDFVETDPLTGEKLINEQALRNRIAEVDQRALRAEQTISSYVKAAEQRETERQNTETYASYPELNPYGQKFDAEFNREVRAVLTDSFYNFDEYGGRPLSFKEAADFIRSKKPVQPTAADVAKAQAEAQAQADAAKAAKEQASKQATSQPQGQRQVADDQELENLRYRTRYFDDNEALARRIMHTEHILPRED